MVHASYFDAVLSALRVELSWRICAHALHQQRLYSITFSVYAAAHDSEASPSADVFDIQTVKTTKAPVAVAMMR
jgi:hypothetical protein